MERLSANEDVYLSIERSTRFYGSSEGLLVQLDKGTSSLPNTLFMSPALLANIGDSNYKISSHGHSQLIPEELLAKVAALIIGYGLAKGMVELSKKRKKY